MEKQWGPYQITEDYRIAADILSYTLYKRRIPENGKLKGEVQWDAIGYFGSVHHLLQKLLSLQIAESLGDFGKAFERIQQVEKNLDKLVKIKYEREKSWMS